MGPDSGACPWPTETVNLLARFSERMKFPGESLETFQGLDLLLEGDLRPFQSPSLFVFDESLMIFKIRKAQLSYIFHYLYLLLKSSQLCHNGCLNNISSRNFQKLSKCQAPSPITHNTWLLSLHRLHSLQSIPPL